MKVLVTGADGFIGKNLISHLSQCQDIDVVSFTRANQVSELPTLVSEVDCIFHLAGVNRPKDASEFLVNSSLTHEICNAIIASGCKVPVIYTSSVQAIQDNAYGLSKRASEDTLLELRSTYKNPVYIFRLPGIFGKWCKPNYNSVVATFCYNLAHDIPIKINDSKEILNLAYVDDVISQFFEIMNRVKLKLAGDGFEELKIRYTITTGELAEQLQAFKDSRNTLMTERVGVGLLRALYSTYLSYLTPDSFAYSLRCHRDARGVFTEFMKTPDCGQISFFTAHPGVTRGGHYHHTKAEKFLVIKGMARFKFKSIQTEEEFELVVDERYPKIVETIPGWTHDITNVGAGEIVVLLWANEIFDHTHPDTYVCSQQGGV